MQTSWEVRSVASSSWGSTSWIARSSTGWLFAAGFFAAAIDDVITAQFQSTLSLAANTTIAVSQGASQCRNNFWSAAAAVLAGLIADFVSSLTTDAVVSIVQSIDESSDDLWIAFAVVLVTDFVDGFSTVFCIASGLRFVDQASKFARIIFCTWIFAAAVDALVAASGRSSTSWVAWSGTAWIFAARSSRSCTTWIFAAWVFTAVVTAAVSESMSEFLEQATLEPLLTAAQSLVAAWCTHWCSTGWFARSSTSWIAWGLATWVARCCTTWVFAAWISWCSTTWVGAALVCWGTAGCWATVVAARWLDV